MAVYFIMTHMMKPEMEEIAGGRATIRQQLDAVGPMTVREWKLLTIVLVLLGFWASEKVLHSFDTLLHHHRGHGADAAAAPGRDGLEGIAARLPLGNRGACSPSVSAWAAALLRTNAAGWLANLIVHNLGLQKASAFAILLLSVFLFVIHLGFASATALASTMIPIIISVLLAVETPGINVVRTTMLLQFVVSFGFILPVNAPQNMIARLRH